MTAPIYYRIRLDPSPYRICAYSNRAEFYHWNYLKSENRCRCEISFLQEGTLYELRDGREHVYQQGTVNTLVSHRAVSRHSKGLIHEFNFVFFTAKTAELMEEEAVAEWSDAENEAIVPELVSDPAICRQIANLMKSAVELGDSDRIARGLIRRTALYECLYLLTRSAVEQARQNLMQPKPRRHPHTELALNYIRTHLPAPLAASKIAAAIGVNYNTLAVSFRRDMNMSLTEYVTLSRIRQVEQLITVEGLPLDKAGALVGIHNRNYLSWLFHRTTGITVREYRRVYSQHWELQKKEAR